jgi:peptidoglycan hydrolase-like protein with peptidoglycan-binding domain
MKDVLDDGGADGSPLPFLAHGASLILGVMIVYNAFFGQHGMEGKRAAHGLSTRVEVPAQGNTIVLRYDAQVEEIQRALLSLGHYKGMVDGVAGEQTKRAIEAYQRRTGLAVDGEPSDALLQSIRFTQQVAEASEFTGTIMPRPKPADRKQMLDVQTVLAELGYEPGEITGEMNGATGAAISRFERDRGLPETGEVSARLIEALSETSGDSSLAGN